MENAPPLIPDERAPPYADVSPILRQAFQDLFNTDVKESRGGKRAKKPGALSRDNITKAEQNLMCKHAEYLLCQNILDNNYDIMDHMHLRQPRMIGSPKEEYRNTYHLLTAQDLKGFNYERYFDSFDSKVSLFENPNKCSGIGTHEIRGIKKHIERPRTFPGVKNQLKDKTTVKIVNVFEVIPEIVIFHNYEPHVKYVKTLKLRNRTNRSVHFSIRPLRLGQFQVDLGKVSPIAPPGVPVIIRIQFKGCDSIGVRARLHVQVQNGENLDIDLIAYRDPPILKGIVLDLEMDLNRTGSTISDIPRQTDREKVLNRSIECGSCLLGDFKEILLLVRNIGGAGRFFIVSEEDWYSSMVNDVTTDGYLVCPPFCMSPVYFSVKPGGVAALQTIFLPRICGAHVERVLLICDNCTIRGADLLGDGVIFSRDFISIDVPLKEYDIIMDGDNDAVHHIDLGEVPVNTSKKFPFTITNTGPVELSFYWEMYVPKVVWTAANPQIECLPLSDINIVPINGIIEANEIVNFTMNVDAKCHGNFRACVALYASNIPSECLEEIPESCIQHNSNCDVDRVDVLLSSVEIWVKCCPVSLTIEPCTVDISCGNITGSHVEFPLEVKNVSQFETSLEICYCGPIGDTGDKIPPQRTRRGISPRTLAIKEKPKTISDKVKPKIMRKPCASIPGKTCDVKCRSKNACRAEYNKEVPLDKAKPQFESCLVSNGVDRERTDEYESDSPICVVPHNFIGCDRSVASLTPIQALIEPTSTLKLRVNLKLDGCQKTHERFIFMSSDGPSPIYKFDVKVRSCRPCLDISKTVIDFGETKQGVRISTTFQITKICCSSICWTLKEYSYNFVYFGFVTCVNKNMSTNKGVLSKRKPSVSIVYNLTTKKFGPMLSILEIKCWKNKKALSEFYYVIIRAMVHAPIVSIKVVGKDTSVLSPCETLYTKIPYKAQVNIKNYSKVPISFMWSKPIGKQAYYMKINFFPKAAVVHPGETMPIELTITPKHHGLIDKFFVPCFIGRESDPLILAIVCTVESVSVTFSIANELSNGEPTVSTVLWSSVEMETSRPVRESKDSGNEDDETSMLSAEYAMKEKQEAFEDLRPEIEVRTHNLDEDPKEVKGPKTYSAKTSFGCPVSDTEDNVKDEEHSADMHSAIQDSYWRYLFMEGMLTNVPRLSMYYSKDDKRQFNDFNNADSDDYLDLHKSPVSENLKNLQFPVISQSVQVLDIQKSSKESSVIVMKIMNLQARVPAVKSIWIRNQTPIQSKFKVIVDHYKTSNDIDAGVMIDNINAKVHGQPYDEWADRVPRGQGLLIHPNDEEYVDLEGYSCYNIDIWFYADTWGIYHDMITIHVEGLRPFEIPVVVIVYGYPVCIPISNNSPTLDFGSFSKDGGIVSKKFLIKNICGIPLKISWHVFMGVTNDFNYIHESEPFPFNIVLDIFDIANSKKADDNGNLRMLTDRGLDLVLTDYYGTEVYKAFIVAPSISEVGPRSSTWVTVHMKSKYLRTEYQMEMDMHDVQCSIVGFIRVNSADKIKEPHLIRMDGGALKPVYLLGKAQSLVNQTSIELLSCDYSTSVSATDIMSSCTRCLKLCHRILLRNNGDRIKINLTTEEPYQIAALKTREMFLEETTRDIDVVMHRSEILEIDLECLLQSRHVWSAWELLHKSQNELSYTSSAICQYIKKSATIRRFLVLTADAHIKQTLKMDVEIFFPDLRFSSDDFILFGPVFIGDTATKSVIMNNKSGCKTDFEVQMKYDVAELELITKFGTVAPAIGNNVYSTMIHVKFCPKACKKYSNVIQILTYLPFYNFQIYVAGYGTHDSKYRVLETIVC